MEDKLGDSAHLPKDLQEDSELLVGMGQALAKRASDIATSAEQLKGIDLKDLDERGNSAGRKIYFTHFEEDEQGVFSIGGADAEITAVENLVLVFDFFYGPAKIKDKETTRDFESDFVVTLDNHLADGELAKKREDYGKSLEDPKDIFLFKERRPKTYYLLNKDGTTTKLLRFSSEQIEDSREDIADHTHIRDKIIVADMSRGDYELVGKILADIGTSLESASNLRP